MTTPLSFPLSGYHSNLPFSNTHSIFELVTKDEMYTVPTSEELSIPARVALYNTLADIATDGIGDVIRDVEEYLQEETIPPFGWMGLATKKDGLEYQGSFIKRFMAWAWKTHHVKFPASFASSIGSIIGKDVAKGEKAHYLRFDPLMHYFAGCFGDDGSCYWESRQGARMLIRNNGGSFIEFFNSPDAHLSSSGTVAGGKGLGRCWVLPINQFLDAQFRKEYAFIVCNFYADETAGLNSYNMARSVANVLGMGYNKIDVRSNLDTLWINSSHGFLLSNNQELINEVGYVRLNWDEDDYSDKTDPELRGLVEYECSECGDNVTEEDWHDEYDLCQSCYENRFHFCADCDCEIDTYNESHAQMNGEYVCRDCLHKRGYERCAHCSQWKPAESVKSYLNDSLFSNEIKLCDNCVKSYHKCEHCGVMFNQTYSMEENDNNKGHWLCERCLHKAGYYFYRCQMCGEIFAIINSNTREERNLCSSCRPRYHICKSSGCNRAINPDSTYCSRHQMWSTGG